MGDADVEGVAGVGDLDGDGPDGEAVGGYEAVRGGYGEGGDGWSRIVVLGVIRVLGVGGGEKEAEVGGLEEVGGVKGVAGGEVGFGDDGHSESPGEAAGGIGGVGGPELDVVEAEDGEAIGPGIGSDEVGVADELEG